MHIADRDHVLFLIVASKSPPDFAFRASLFNVFDQDRTNLGNARVAGLQKDLHLTNYQVFLFYFGVMEPCAPILISVFAV